MKFNTVAKFAVMMIMPSGDSIELWRQRRFVSHADAVHAIRMYFSNDAPHEIANVPELWIRETFTPTYF